MKLVTAIVERGIVNPQAVVMGLSESLLTPVAGMFVLVDRGVPLVLPEGRPLVGAEEAMMEARSVLVGLAIGACTFALTWATVRHFTGLAQEQAWPWRSRLQSALTVGVGYAVVESRLFDLWLRRRH